MYNLCIFKSFAKVIILMNYKSFKQILIIYPFFLTNIKLTSI